MKKKKKNNNNNNNTNFYCSESVDFFHRLLHCYKPVSKEHDVVRVGEIRQPEGSAMLHPRCAGQNVP